MLDCIGKVFSPLTPAEILKLCIIYIPQIHFQQRGPSSCTCLSFSAGSVRRCSDSKHYPIIGKVRSSRH